MNDKEIDPEKYYWAHRELQAIVKNSDRQKLANWMKTHKGHAYVNLLIKGDPLAVSAEQLLKVQLIVKEEMTNEPLSEPKEPVEMESIYNIFYTTE